MCSFDEVFDYMAEAAHVTAKSKGWHDTKRNDGEMIALMHSELSEALEAMRHGNPVSEKLPKFTSVEEELADVVIRIMDFAALHHYSVGGAIFAKMQYNENRPHKHGGKQF